MKKAVEEGQRSNNMTHEEVIDVACKSLMEELEKEKKEREKTRGYAEENTTTGNANDKNEWLEDAHLEVEDDYSGAGWEKAKTKREKRRGKSKSSLAEEYEALTL